MLKYDLFHNMHLWHKVHDMNADIDILYHNEIILSIYFQPLNFYLDIKRRHDKVV